MGSASSLAAKLTRELWADYKATYQPIATTLMDRLTYNNPSVVTEGVANATDEVNAAYDATNANRLTALSRYGIAPTAAQNASASRINEIERSKAVVNAANTIRTRLADRDRALLFGSLGMGNLYDDKGGE